MKAKVWQTSVDRTIRNELKRVRCIVGRVQAVLSVIKKKPCFSSIIPVILFPGHR